MDIHCAAILALALAQSAGEREFSFEEYGLTLEFPEEFGEVEAHDEPHEQRKGMWTGEIEGLPFRATLWLLASGSFGFSEPEDVTDFIADNYRRGMRGGGVDPNFAWTEQSTLQGPYGFAPYGSICQAARRGAGRTDAVGSLFVLGGLLEHHGYCVELETAPAANPDQAASLLSFFDHGVRYEGTIRDAQWSEAEAEARWNEHAPESAKGRDFDKPLRTKHYLILTNSSGGKSFAKKMEENYTKIQKVYPFPEVDGHKLMPVFLFRTNQQYYEYCMSVAGWSEAQAKASKGHAWRDYYATWYESPNDPVHIHEATHQIFKNRLRLNGGGSWFQEGVAEYIETKKNDRNNAARMVESGEGISLRELMSLSSLLQSSGNDQRFGNQAGQNYKTAALLVEFLRESRDRKDKFPDYLKTVGMLARGDLGGIDAALRSLYGESIEELEAKWREYCAKR